MHSPKSSVIFDQDRASSYDEKFLRLAPLRSALHLLIRLILAELPANARVLCVGVGTGLELVDLAQAFPQWQFVAVEPAPAMLNVCRQRVADAGLSARCMFHEGYLDSLPASEPFAAATCLLVSHFLIDQETRCNFFRQISARLHPNGYLITADLVADMSTSIYQSQLKVWLDMLKYAETPAAEISNFCDSYGRDVAILPPNQIESILTSSGFSEPVLFFQTLLIHAWYAKAVFPR